MENRFSKLSRNAGFGLLLLAACGMTSCKDEYILDDEKPAWLSSSIYSGLEENGHYDYYLRLLSDPDVQPTNARPLPEVLSKTGSKTVFVANDDAWKAFFEANAKLPESNPWHSATSYENLSVSQKKLLIHTSMLNNAIVMENLSSSSSSISSRGSFMRRYTDVATTDSITYLDGNSLPTNYNKDNQEKDYWFRFRSENGGNGIYMVADSTEPMMIHFTNEHLSANNVTDDDFAKFMGMERSTPDVHIFDAKLIEKDAVAENGYINVTDKVIYPLPNMAEAIRTSGRTNIFSHMLDRWSVPFYNNTVTVAYTNVMASRGITWTDSIFSKRYFSELSYRHRKQENDPNGNPIAGKDVGLLKFDPGWNAYAFDDTRWNSNSTTAPQYDMAAMFVPDDDAMWEYFTEGGGGWQLIRTYYMREGLEDEIPYTKPTSLEELYQQIDQVPLGTLGSLLNVIMFPSFVGSVPSKMTTLRDDAQEQIFYPEDIDHITSTIMANNGMIYITDRVYGPADYTSVAAPAYISNTNSVMKWAIYNGDTKTVKGTDYMGLNYYAYLKAMQSDFAFFLPSDDAMAYYYDPVSFKSKKPRMLNFFYKTAAFPINFKMYNYIPTTGEYGQLYNLERMTNQEITNRLKDILESHTIVLDGVEEIDSSEDEYFLAKNGAAVKVTREPDANGIPRIVKVQGGFQLENEKAGIEGFVGEANKEAYTEVRGVQHNIVTDEQRMANGTTYILDSPMIPASRSVFNILTNDQQYDDEAYEAFYELCNTNLDIIKACGLVDELELAGDPNKIATELKKYQIFINDNGPDYNVQFFNNYRYTVFVPSYDAIQDAISKGLPTWEDIQADYDACEKTEEEGGALTNHTDSMRLRAKITYLVNFIRYHFADNSVFVDKSTFPSTDYVTASYDNKKGLFCKIFMKRPESDVLQVQDNCGGPWITVSDNNNIMARDVACKDTPLNQTSMNGITIDGSSFAVIHQIPTALFHAPVPTDWDNEEEIKEYLTRFAIH